MINERFAKEYCCDDITLIENYDKAINDLTQTWHCHHKLEIHTDYRNSESDLKLMNLYYKRPAEELIFVTSADHVRMHHCGKVCWTRGTHLSKSHRSALSNSMIGKNKGKHWKLINGTRVYY